MSCRTRADSEFDSVHSIQCADYGELLTLVIPDSVSAAPPEHALAPDKRLEFEHGVESLTLTVRGTDAAARFRAAQDISSRT